MAIDPIWLLKVYTVNNMFHQSNQPALYYLTDGSSLEFFREKMMVVHPDTESPPNRILILLRKQKGTIRETA